MRERYRTLGLPFRPRDTPVLRHIVDHGPSSIRAIADATGSTHSAISQTVSEMRRKGLLEIANGRDARERVVAPSARSRDLMTALQKCWSETDCATDELNAQVGCDLPRLLTRALEHVERSPSTRRNKGAA